MQGGIVYLLHFNRPYKHARHYIGFTTDLAQRLTYHRRGKAGSHLMRVLFDEGIEFVVAQTWTRDPRSGEPATRATERWFKNWHGASKFCPICKNGAHAHRSRV